MNISLEIQTTDATALLVAVAGKAPTRNDEVAISADMALRYIGTETYRGADTTAIILFALNFPVGIATNVITGIIGDYLRKRSAKSVPVSRARLIITTEIEQVDEDGTRVITESTTYRTVIDEDA